jgi:hypothetical protein
MADSFTWSVGIENGPGTLAGQTVFRPDQRNSGQGVPLSAQTGDTVTWTNNTGVVHEIWQTVNGKPVDTGTPFVPASAGTGGALTPAQQPTVAGLMSNPIPPGSPSAPAYVIAAASGTTVTYCCLLHPNETGSIAVTTFT